MFGHGAFVKPFAEPMGGAGVAAFAPTDIANPIVGFDASSAYYQDSARTTLATADGDRVGSWSDLVGTNHAAQATAGDRLTLKRNQRDGTRPALLGDGVSDFLATPSIAHGVGTGDFYWFIIEKYNGTNYDFPIASLGASFPFFGENTNNNVKLVLSSPQEWGGHVNGTWYAMEIVRSGGTFSYYLNGTLKSPTSAQADSIPTAVLYLMTNNAGQFNPSMIEAFWFFKTAPTVGQMAQMRTYYGF